ncbi:MAG TPA: hypothetical protein VGE39_14925 [Prosthecobacter sp.]
MKKIQFRLLVAAAVCSLSSCVGDPFYGYGGYAPGLPPVSVSVPGFAFGPPPPSWGYGGGRPPSFGYGPRPASRLSTGSLRGVDSRSPDVRRAPDPTLMLLR